MRSIKSLLMAAVMVAGMPVVAHAQWYVGADVGVGITEDQDLSGGGVSIKGETDPGFVGLGQVGHQFGSWKVEGELGYRLNDVDNIAGVSLDGDVDVWSLMANGIYEFMPESKWHPFVGAGIGWAWLNANDIGNGSVTVDADDNQFAYQGFAGVGYDVTDNLGVKAQYRYFATLDPEYKTTGGAKVNGEYANHSFLVGLTYKFKTPAPAPEPTPVAAPAPAPKPMPTPKNFMVFFDFDRANVTPDAAAIIDQAAKAAKLGQMTRVNLTGHADRAGSDKYNMALSMKRANNIKAALVSMGIPADQISVVAKGESDPLVQTPDGVREPQNRRVEIVLP